MNIDYKILLERYMEEVMLTEGTDFLHVFGDAPSKSYTKEELLELKRISEKNHSKRKS